MTDIEIQNLVAQIRRAQAETDKFVEEGQKLRAEGKKFERERTTVLITSAAAALGAVAAVGGLVGGLVVRFWMSP